jgi:hypothetical protein
MVLFFRRFAFGDSGAAFKFVVGEHGAAAVGGAAVAVGGFVVGVVEVVLVDEFFAGGDVADGLDVDAAIVLFGLAVGGAGVVDEHGGGEAVDDVGGAVDGEEVGDGLLGVALVGDVLGDAGAVVLEDAAAAGDGVERDDAGGVDFGGLDEQAGCGRGNSAKHGVEYSKGLPVRKIRTGWGGGRRRRGPSTRVAMAL